MWRLLLIVLVLGTGCVVPPPPAPFHWDGPDCPSTCDDPHRPHVGAASSYTSRNSDLRAMLGLSAPRVTGRYGSYYRTYGLSGGEPTKGSRFRWDRRREAYVISKGKVEIAVVGESPSLPPRPAEDTPAAAYHEAFKELQRDLDQIPKGDELDVGP